MAYRYFLKLAYNGSAYGGWQSQPNAVTVQQLIENGLQAVAGSHRKVTGCGRTDAGVHASVFYAHFDHDEAFSTEQLKQLAFKLNRFLPMDIVIDSIRPVFSGAHARFSALWREYEYVIIRQKDPFRYKDSYFVHGVLDIEMMNQCSSILLGKHDFECFSKTHTQVNNFFCTIEHAQWIENEHILNFSIRADRFLRNMVRAIVGTLLDVGRGKISIQEFEKIIESHNRSAAGYSVPAQGLTLTGIGYAEEIFSDSPVFFVEEQCK
jgi:tRNA pseudouridine38-40 synthase